MGGGLAARFALCRCISWIALMASSERGWYSADCGVACGVTLSVDESAVVLSNAGSSLVKRGVRGEMGSLLETSVWISRRAKLGVSWANFRLALIISNLGAGFGLSRTWE